MTSEAPADWVTIQLGDILEFKNGLNKEKKYFGTGTPIVNFMDVLKYPILTKDRVNGRVTLTRDEIERFSARTGDVFFTRTSESVEEIGTASVLCEAIPDAVFSGFVLRGRAKSKRLDPTFLAYALQSRDVRNQVISTATYTTRALTNGRSLSRVRLPVPPIGEQISIGSAMVDVDELIAGLERLISKKQKIRHGMMYELLTGSTRLPGFNDTWRNVKLGEVASMGSGGTPSSKVAKFYGGGIPWVSISDMTAGGKYIHHTEKTLTTEGVSASAARLYDPNVVLYAMYASIGECSLAVGRVSSSQAILGISPGSSLDREFLYYYLTRIRPQVKTMGQQGTQSNLNAGMVRKFELKLPTLSEQRAIATVLSDADKELDALTSKLSQSRSIKLGMMQELLTGRTRLESGTAS